MIDIHTHILPGADDGASNIQDTLEMVRMAADIGVTAMIATPHCNIPGGYSNYLNEEYKERFFRAAEAVQQAGIPVQILPGAEVFATYDLARLIHEGQILTLNGSRYLLIEFDFGEDPAFADDVLGQVADIGIRPVIAHAERYEFVQEIPQIVYEWKKKGYLIQINKGSVMGRFGYRAQLSAEWMLDEYLVSVIASDAHSPRRRTPYLLDAYGKLKRKYSRKYLQALFDENPRRICENRPVVRFRTREEIERTEK